MSQILVCCICLSCFEYYFTYITHPLNKGSWNSKSAVCLWISQSLVSLDTIIRDSHKLSSHFLVISAGKINRWWKSIPTALLAVVLLDLLLPFPHTSMHTKAINHVSPFQVWVREREGEIWVLILCIILMVVDIMYGFVSCCYCVGKANPRWLKHSMAAPCLTKMLWCVADAVINCAHVMWVPACVCAEGGGQGWFLHFVCVAVCVSLHLGCETCSFCWSFALICSFAINARVKNLHKIVLCQ